MILNEKAFVYRLALSSFVLRKLWCWYAYSILVPVLVHGQLENTISMLSII